MSSTSPPRTPGLPPARHLAAILLLAGMFGTACSTTESRSYDIEMVQDAIRRGRYEEALRQAGELQQENPGVAEFEELHRMTTVAYYLGKGRQATFDQQDLEAMDWFGRALEIAPDDHRVKEWIRKTSLKIAEIQLYWGHEAFASDDLPAALAAYRVALEYAPTETSALSALAEVTLLINYRDGLGVSYYREGVTALSDYWLERAKRDFTVSRKYDEQNSRAARRITDVDRLLAGQRVAVAHSLVEAGFYAGALNEFKLAKALDPESVEAQEGIELIDDEAVAAQILRDVQMSIYRKDFGTAEEMLEEGEALTSLQKEAFQEAWEEVKNARLGGLYDMALACEHDQLFDQAIAAYDSLLKKVDFFKDARARRQTLASYVDQAAIYYGKAMAEDDPVKKQEYLRAIEEFWPEYKDIEALIEPLQ